MAQSSAKDYTSSSHGGVTTSSLPLSTVAIRHSSYQNNNNNKSSTSANSVVDLMHANSTVSPRELPAMLPATMHTASVARMSSEARDGAATIAMDAKNVHESNGSDSAEPGEGLTRERHSFYASKCTSLIKHLTAEMLPHVQYTLSDLSSTFLLQSLPPSEEKAAPGSGPATATETAARQHANATKKASQVLAMTNLVESHRTTSVGAHHSSAPTTAARTDHSSSNSCTEMTAPGERSVFSSPSLTRSGCKTRQSSHNKNRSHHCPSYNDGAKLVAASLANGRASTDGIRDNAVDAAIIFTDEDVRRKPQLRELQVSRNTVQLTDDIIREAFPDKPQPVRTAQERQQKLLRHEQNKLILLTGRVNNLNEDITKDVLQQQTSRNGTGVLPEDAGRSTNHTDTLDASVPWALPQICAHDAAMKSNRTSSAGHYVKINNPTQRDAEGKDETDEEDGDETEKQEEFGVRRVRAVTTQLGHRPGTWKQRPGKMGTAQHNKRAKVLLPYATSTPGAQTQSSSQSGNQPNAEAAPSAAACKTAAAVPSRALNRSNEQKAVHQNTRMNDILWLIDSLHEVLSSGVDLDEEEEDSPHTARVSHAGGGDNSSMADSGEAETAASLCADAPAPTLSDPRRVSERRSTTTQPMHHSTSAHSDRKAPNSTSRESSRASTLASESHSSATALSATWAHPDMRASIRVTRERSSSSNSGSAQATTLSHVGHVLPDIASGTAHPTVSSDTLALPTRSYARNRAHSYDLLEPSVVRFSLLSSLCEVPWTDAAVNTTASPSITAHDAVTSSPVNGSSHGADERCNACETANENTGSIRRSSSSSDRGTCRSCSLATSQIDNDATTDGADGAGVRRQWTRIGPVSKRGQMPDENVASGRMDVTAGLKLLDFMIDAVTRARSSGEEEGGGCDCYYGAAMAEPWICPAEYRALFGLSRDTVFPTWSASDHATYNNNNNNSSSSSSSSSNTCVDSGVTEKDARGDEEDHNHWAGEGGAVPAGLSLSGSLITSQQSSVDAATEHETRTPHHDTAVFDSEPIAATSHVQDEAADAETISTSTAERMVQPPKQKRLTKKKKMRKQPPKRRGRRNPSIAPAAPTEDNTTPEERVSMAERGDACSSVDAASQQSALDATDTDRTAQDGAGGGIGGDMHCGALYTLKPRLFHTLRHLYARYGVDGYIDAFRAHALEQRRAREEESRIAMQHRLAEQQVKSRTRYEGKGIGTLLDAESDAALRRFGQSELRSNSSSSSSSSSASSAGRMRSRAGSTSSSGRLGRIVAPARGAEAPVRLATTRGVQDAKDDCVAEDGLTLHHGKWEEERGRARATGREGGDGASKRATQSPPDAGRGTLSADRSRRSNMHASDTERNVDSSSAGSEKDKIVYSQTLPCGLTFTITEVTSSVVPAPPGQHAMGAATSAATHGKKGKTTHTSSRSTNRTFTAHDASARQASPQHVPPRSLRARFPSPSSKRAAVATGRATTRSPARPESVRDFNIRVRNSQRKQSCTAVVRVRGDDVAGRRATLTTAPASTAGVSREEDTGALYARLHPQTSLVLCRVRTETGSATEGAEGAEAAAVPPFHRVLSFHGYSSDGFDALGLPAPMRVVNDALSLHSSVIMPSAPDTPHYESIRYRPRRAGKKVESARRRSFRKSSGVSRAADGRTRAATTTTTATAAAAHGIPSHASSSRLPSSARARTQEAASLAAAAEGTPLAHRPDQYGLPVGRARANSRAARRAEARARNLVAASITQLGALSPSGSRIAAPHSTHTPDSPTGHEPGPRRGDGGLPQHAADTAAARKSARDGDSSARSALDATAPRRGGQDGVVRDERASRSAGRTPVCGGRNRIDATRTTDEADSFVAVDERNARGGRVGRTSSARYAVVAYDEAQHTTDGARAHALHSHRRALLDRALDEAASVHRLQAPPVHMTRSADTGVVHILVPGDVRSIYNVWRPHAQPGDHVKHSSRTHRAASTAAQAPPHATSPSGEQSSKRRFARGVDEAPAERDDEEEEVGAPARVDPAVVRARRVLRRVTRHAAAGEKSSLAPNAFDEAHASDEELASVELQIRELYLSDPVRYDDVMEDLLYRAAERVLGGSADTLAANQTGQNEKAGATGSAQRLPLRGVRRPACASTGRVFDLLAEASSRAALPKEQSTTRTVQRILFEHMKAKLLLRCLVASMRAMWSSKATEQYVQNETQLRDARARALQVSWCVHKQQAMNVRKLIHILDRRVGRVHGWVPFYSDDNVLTDTDDMEDVDVAAEWKKDAKGTECARCAFRRTNRRITAIMQLAKRHPLLPLALVRRALQSNDNAHLLFGYHRQVIASDESNDACANRAYKEWRNCQGRHGAGRRSNFYDMRSHTARIRYRRRLQCAAPFQHPSSMFSPPCRHEVCAPLVLHIQSLP